MARKIIVVTAAYGNDHVKALGGQSAVLPFIAGSGADGVEIRRELFSADELNRLAELAADIERRGLLVCYSAPEALFAADGALNPHLSDLLQEAQTLNALWLKLSLGHFTHHHGLETLRDILRESGMALVVENDQTDCGQLAPMQRFKAACRVNQLPITLTFDMGNWLWVGDSPEEAARHLAPAVSYIHVKAAEPHHSHFRAVPPDEASGRWLALLDNLPRRYVNLLRED